MCVVHFSWLVFLGCWHMTMCLDHGAVSLGDHLAHLDLVPSIATRNRKDQFWSLVSSMLSRMHFMTSWVVCQAVDFHTSSWLNVLPLVHHQFDLSARQSCDTSACTIITHYSWCQHLVIGVKKTSVCWIATRVVWSLSIIVKSEMLWSYAYMD